MSTFMVNVQYHSAFSAPSIIHNSPSNKSGIKTQLGKHNVHLIVKLFQHKPETIIRWAREKFAPSGNWTVEPFFPSLSGLSRFRRGQMDAKICLSFQFQRSAAQFIEVAAIEVNRNRETTLKNQFMFVFMRWERTKWIEWDGANFVKQRNIDFVKTSWFSLFFMLHSSEFYRISTIPNSDKDQFKSLFKSLNTNLHHHRSEIKKNEINQKAPSHRHVRDPQKSYVERLPQRGQQQWREAPNGNIPELTHVSFFIFAAWLKQSFLLY